ncbi:hypothetical protein BD779DRAFT_664432 [Infundibulicybe gibba]|nr:hypothetical protein BD779DRAFT_664432 [Infundibulicybe gibba]
MGEISQMVGQADDASRFKVTRCASFELGADLYREGPGIHDLEDWENRTILSNHITSTYGQSASWGLIYNLFPDRLLRLDFITQEVGERNSHPPLAPSHNNIQIYDDQTKFYAMQIPAAGEFGIEYDSSTPNRAKSHWTC